MENRQRVVVTGMGVISPIGNDVPTFWNNIQHGVSGIGPLTKCDTAGLDSRVSAEVKGFDPKAYFEVKEVKRMALFTQYAVAAAKEAWRDAGFEGPAAMPDRTAVILGNGIGGREVDHEAHKTLFEKGAQRISPMAIPKLIINEAAGNISMTLNAKGPVLTIVTACASGTDAIGVALDAIRSGRADVVITGGTEAAITPVAIGGFCALGALSTKCNDTPKKACRPFDLNRDGFVMGEGAGILIIETLEHAQKRGARIHAELAGYGATGDAFHLTAPEPSGDGAARAIRVALQDAGLKPTDIDYFNAHGTSTPINDPMETQAIKLAFGDEARRLKVSSTKSMTGHMIAAAGAVEAIVCVLACRDGFCPPTINYETPDPACDLDYVPNVGVTMPVRAAVSTSLGFGGHNGAVVIKRFDNA
ncbi:MAG: beta-ketoacyl-ACP synthase II [Lentisphaerae bacterium]|nr:beta-ketoacyl-ACP synthase II [Lentisphaerota bacterium]